MMDYTTGFHTFFDSFSLDNGDIDLNYCDHDIDTDSTYLCNYIDWKTDSLIEIAGRSDIFPDNKSNNNNNNNNIKSSM